MKPKTAEKILSQTQETYNAIVSDFDRTRSYLWPGLKAFIKFVKPGDAVLDLGCGNGKLRLLFKDVNLEYTGLDSSTELLKLAAAKKEFSLPHQSFVLGEAYKLPFADNSFDAVFFIAVFHHLPGREWREKALAEIKRVLKPNGYLIMTNWNRYQKDFLHYIIKYTFLKLIGQSELDFKDIYLPWMGGKAYRYYHAFTLGELKKLVKKSGLKLEENYLASFDGQPLEKTAYWTAANLVTVAQKRRETA